MKILTWTDHLKRGEISIISSPALQEMMPEAFLSAQRRNLSRNKYRTENKFKETFGIQGIEKFKSKLVCLDFDFTSLHDYLGTSRHVLNQHASILNHLRSDVVQRCTKKEMCKHFDLFTQTYPRDSIITQFENINKQISAKLSKSPKFLKNQLNAKQLKSSISSVRPRGGDFNLHDGVAINNRAKSIPFSPGKGSYIKSQHTKIGLKHSADKFNAVLKHMADQIILLAKNILRIDKNNQRQDQEIDQKLYRREFESIFDAQSNKILDFVNPFIERYNEKLDNLSKELSQASTTFEERIDGYHGNTVNVLTDLESKVAARPTLEYFESILENRIEKFEQELASKVQKKLDNIKIDQNKPKTGKINHEGLLDQVKFCLTELKSCKDANEGFEEEQRKMKKQMKDLEEKVENKIEVAKEDFDHKITTLLNKDFRDLEERLKTEITLENEKQIQFEKTEEEISTRLENFNNIIDKTVSEIDDKIRVSMLSSASGIGSGSIETMIKNKIQIAVKHIIETNKKEEAKSKASDDFTKQIDKKFKALKREIQTLELSILKNSKGDKAKKSAYKHPTSAAISPRSKIEDVEGRMINMMKEIEHLRDKIEIISASVPSMGSHKARPIPDDYIVNSENPISRLVNKTDNNSVHNRSQVIFTKRNRVKRNIQSANSRTKAYTTTERTTVRDYATNAAQVRINPKTKLRKNNLATPNSIDSNNGHGSSTSMLAKRFDKPGIPKSLGYSKDIAELRRKNSNDTSDVDLSLMPESMFPDYS